VEIAHETPWLVAALSKITARDPRSANRAALAVPAGTPSSRDFDLRISARR
jgi:hypothetical protein